MSLLSRVRERAPRLRDYCQANGYNTHIALFVDLGRHSGLCRFVVWDFDEAKAIITSPVSHGSGSQTPRKRSCHALTSNDDDSHLSSIGRALVAERYVGRYGVAYRLDGLDDTNSNLRKRYVVLHGWKYTTSMPIWPLATVGSFGCPVLSRRVMAHVDTILQQETRVLLLTYM